MAGFRFLQVLFGRHLLGAEFSFPLQCLVGERGLGHRFGDLCRPNPRDGLFVGNLAAEIDGHLLNHAADRSRDLRELVLIETELRITLDAIGHDALFGFGGLDAGHFGRLAGWQGGVAAIRPA